MSIVVSSEFLDDPGCSGRGGEGREPLPAGRRSSGIGAGRMRLVGGGKLSGFRKSILHGRKRSSTEVMKRLSGLVGGEDGAYDGDGADHKKVRRLRVVVAFVARFVSRGGGGSGDTRICGVVTAQQDMSGNRVICKE